MSEAAISAAADTWTRQNWDTRFGELGSFDFAREAFMAGAYFGMGFEAASGGDPMGTGLDRVAAAVRKARGGDPPAQVQGFA